MDDSLDQKIIAQNKVEVFICIVCPQNLNFRIKLSLNHDVEVSEDSINLIFFLQKEYSC